MSEQAPGAVLRGAVDLSSLRGRQTPPAGGAAPQAPAGAMPAVFDMVDADLPQVLELSQRVPVVIELQSVRLGVDEAFSSVLQNVVTSLAGRVVLARVDADANPQLAQGFRVQTSPLVVALIAGQPVPIFNGAAPEAQVQEVFGQLLQLAAQNGVTGTVPVADANSDAPAEEPALPPLHQAAFDAIERGDYAAAATAYEQALGENPRDADARAGLGQVRLLQRVEGKDLQVVRAAAAAAPQGIAEQFDVADMDLAGGHVEDAFGRLLDLFAALPDDDRAPVRERLIELFGVVGEADPRVTRARGRLASLLF